MVGHYRTFRTLPAVTVQRARVRIVLWSGDWRLPRDLDLKLGSLDAAFDFLAGLPGEVGMRWPDVRGNVVRAKLTRVRREPALAAEAERVVCGELRVYRRPW